MVIHKKNEQDSVFVDHVISVRRVTKVTKGGKRFSFSAFVVSGNKGGEVGIGKGSAREVSLAIAKATNHARKNMVTIPLRGTTLPYDVVGRHGASRVLIRPASEGTGNIAGGAVRAVLDAVGVKDALTKSIGSSTALNAAKATLNALAKQRSASHIARLRGKTVKEIVRGA
jgi:small subunit ribosomal protein S5